jgi:hypothetical protein
MHLFAGIEKFVEDCAKWSVVQVDPVGRAPRDPSALSQASRLAWRMAVYGCCSRRIGIASRTCVDEVYFK